MLARLNHIFVLQQILLSTKILSIINIFYTSVKQSWIIRLSSFSVINNRLWCNFPAFNLICFIRSAVLEKGSL